MIKKKLAMGLVIGISSIFLFGSTEASAFYYRPTPSWSKPWLSSDVTFTATTEGGFEAIGCYVFAYAALRTQSGSPLGNGGMQSSFVDYYSEIKPISASSQVSANNNQAKYGYAEYGLAYDSAATNRVPNRYISAEYGNIYY